MDLIFQFGIIRWKQSVLLRDTVHQTSIEPLTSPEMPGWTYHAPTHTSHCIECVESTDSACGYYSADVGLYNKPISEQISLYIVCNYRFHAFIIHPNDNFLIAYAVSVDANYDDCHRYDIRDRTYFLSIYNIWCQYDPNTELYGEIFWFKLKMIFIVLIFFLEYLIEFYIFLMGLTVIS